MICVSALLNHLENNTAIIEQLALKTLLLLCEFPSKVPNFSY